MQFYEASIWDIPENRVHIGQEDEYQLGFVKTTWDEEDQREALNEVSQLLPLSITYRRYHERKMRWVAPIDIRASEVFPKLIST